MGLLFEGGDYSRAASDQGNTVCFNIDRYSRTLLSYPSFSHLPYMVRG